MDLERTFVAIVELGSLNKAADELGIANSTASTRLATLEKKLEAILLQRTARGIHLTEIGRVYYDKIKQALAQTEDIENMVRKMATGSFGKLTLSIPPGLIENWLAKPFADFLDSYHDVHLEIRTTDKILDQVREGFDICFHWGPPPDSTLYAQRLFEDEIILIASKSYVKKYDVNNCPEAVKFLQMTRDFSGETKKRIISKDILDWWYSRAARITSDTVESQIALLLQDMGAAALPRSNIDRLLETGAVADITPIFFNQPFPVTCYAITAEKPSSHSRAQLLIDHIKRFYPQ